MIVVFFPSISVFSTIRRIQINATNLCRLRNTDQPHQNVIKL